MRPRDDVTWVFLVILTMTVGGSVASVQNVQIFGLIVLLPILYLFFRCSSHHAVLVVFLIGVSVFICRMNRVL
jgi:hypothetical protein